MTLTHARIISVEYSSYLRAITKYPAFKAVIEAKVIQLQQRKTKNTLELMGLTPYGREMKSQTEQKQQSYSDTFINVYRYHKTQPNTYWEPFNVFGKFRFIQFFLLPIVVTPYSK